MFNSAVGCQNGKPKWQTFAEDDSPCIRGVFFNSCHSLDYFSCRQSMRMIQRACSARGTYSKRISHTPGTRRASRKFLSIFNFFLSQTRTKRAMIFSDICSDARFERVSDVCLAYVEFCKFSTRPARASLIR